MENDAQIAAVLGHEVAHVNFNHSGERYSQSSLATAGLSVAQIATSGSQYSNQVMGVLGAGAALEPFAQFGLILESCTQYVDITRTQAAVNIVRFQDLLVCCAVQSALAPNALDRSRLLFDQSSDRGVDLLSLAGLFFLQKIVDDEPIVVFSDPKSACVSP